VGEESADEGARVFIKIGIRMLHPKEILAVVF
jgi:hypothetical protein